jgi:hypothetical protein
MLAYFIDPDAPALLAFPTRAPSVFTFSRGDGRSPGVTRLSVDIEPSSRARCGRSVGRPRVADALISGSRRDRTMRSEVLEFGAPAFVPRSGVAPFDVIRVVHDAGGVVSMAHPGLTRRDLIPLSPRVSRARSPPLEHDEATETRYRAMASDLGLLATAGSDYHGDTGRRASMLGTIVMPSEDFEALRRAVERVRS